MSDTPRTDDLEGCISGWPDPNEVISKWMDYARTLERELATMTADRNGVKEMNDRHRARIAELENEKNQLLNLR